MNQNPHLEHGKTYRVATKRKAFLATVEGPIRDGSGEFYIVCGPDGDFDIEYAGGDTWHAGKTIGSVRVRDVH